MFLQANRVLEIDNQLIQSTSNFTRNPTATHKIYIYLYTSLKNLITYIEILRFIMLWLDDLLVKRETSTLQKKKQML
jgi:hypothetical protein